MSKGKVLVVGSNATRIEVQGGTGPTGQYLNETVVPVMALIDAGYDIALATPSKPHIDEASATPVHFGGDEAAFRRAQEFYGSHPSMNPAHTLRSVIDGGLERYAALFVPGGQAPVVMEDPGRHSARKHILPRRGCIEDGTGQNPRSNHMIAEKLIHALQRSAVAA